MFSVSTLLENLASSVTKNVLIRMFPRVWKLIRSKEEGRYTAAVEALVETDADIRTLTENVSSEKAAQVISSAQKPLSAVERKYILLFMSGKSTEEVAEAMHVAPASVYTMKYRIKKKYPDSLPLPF